jgi:hypothetical protein
MTPHNLGPGPVLNKELVEYLTILKHNLGLHEQITSVFVVYNNNFIRTSHAENIVFVQLLKISKNLFPTADAVAMVGGLFGMFFIYALMIPSHTSVIDAGFVWRPRYEIIFQVKELFKQFTLQLELVTGRTLNIDSKTKTLVWVLLQTLINHGTLKSKTCYVAKNKSEVFVAGAAIPNHLSGFTPLKILLNPAKIVSIRNNLYLQTKHYSALQSILRPNKASHKKPQLADLGFLQCRLALRLHINWRLLDKIISIAERKFKISLNAVDDLVRTLTHLKVSWWDPKKQARYHELYRLYYLYCLKQQESYLAPGIYFRYYLDFRGRTYADSPVSYTFNKLTRGLYNYGVYTPEELQNLVPTLPIYDGLVTQIILPRTRLKTLCPELDYTEPCVQYYLFTLFFELGKLQKNKAILAHNGKLNTLDFICLGIEFFNTPPNDEFDFEVLVEHAVLMDILEALKRKQFVKLPVYKDATASALQLLTILLGPASDLHLSETNLKQSGFWYDTYFSIIARFWNKTNIPDDLKTRYFTRAALKKTIMTHNYQATYLTCLNEFKAYNQLPWDNAAGDNIKVIPIFKAFYKYLDILFASNEYFAISSECIVEWFQTRWVDTRTAQFTTLDNLFVPLDYGKITKQRVERLILTKRETILWAALTDEIDETKMFRAVRANIIHSFDGYLVRQVTLRLGYPIITIHDSFGIDILNVSRLITIVQEELTKLVGLNLFNDARTTQSKFRIDSEYILL